MSPMTEIRPCGTRAEFVEFCKSENMAFLAANPKQVHVEYVRTPKGDPTAVLVAVKMADVSMGMGWSAASPVRVDEEGYIIRRADKFSKPIGLWKAIRRAIGQGRDSGVIPNRLISHVQPFMERAAVELSANY